MKTIIVIIVCLCLSVMLKAQVSKTVDVTTAGSLKTMLTQEELQTITDLTLTGTIDARDFKTMRDELLRLVEIDLSKVTIAEYSGTEGTVDCYTFYLNDEIPGNAFDETTYTDTFRLNSISLPSTAKFIGYNAFSGCTRMTTITIPNTITYIGYSAFSGCKSLTSITIPASIDLIEAQAFNDCTGLIYIYCHGLTPPSFNCMARDCEYFFNVNKAVCVLYVPYHRKEVYQGWEFINIVEMPGFLLSKDSVNIQSNEGSKATVDVMANVGWAVSSNQPWLTVSHISGTGDQSLTFTANANTADTSRTAIVTVSSEGVELQTIKMVQDALITKVPEIPQNRPLINCYPNPFSQQITIEIQNLKHVKLTVDIYNLAGQRVKNLAVESTTELLNLTWDGTNERGQKVMPGIYICKMNELSKKLVLMDKF